MDCRVCGQPLERPGDFCLECHTANATAIFLDIDAESATLVMIQDDSVLGETTITTVPETDGPEATVQRRNYLGRVADELHRKRPETVYATGPARLIRPIKARSSAQFYRVDGADPLQTALEGGDPAAPAVDDRPPAAKLGGMHSTLIGERAGREIVLTVAGHPHVKKVIPGPIDASGGSRSGGVTAKATRADETGNVRLLIRDGSSVQENRIVTTADSREVGERIRRDLNELLNESE